MQAAIAACHAFAASYEQTDWDAVVSWYDVLLTLDTGPVGSSTEPPRVAERDGAEAGLAEVDADRRPGRPTRWWHATRAVLLRRLGRDEEAAAADAVAARFPSTTPAAAARAGLVG